MHAVKKLAFFGLPLVLAMGCSNRIHGKWSLTNVEPTAARRDFAYTSFTLQKDGSYYAETQAGAVKTQSGTYTFDGDVLDLVPHNGVRNTYDADLSGDELELEHMWQGKKVEAEFERIE